MAEFVCVQILSSDQEVLMKFLRDKCVKNSGTGRFVVCKLASCDDFLQTMISSAAK